LKRLAGNAALVVGAVLVSLALGELALRALRFSNPSFWLPDELTGARLRPGIEGWSHGEGEAFVKINSRGLRDREHAMPKPPGVYRIAVLGDSYAEALQVELEDTFWWRLAERLQACAFQPGKRIEAVNFGVSGYGTAQQLLTLRHRAWDYSPDLVLLAFFPGNDVRDNSLALEGKNNRPYFVLREGELALDASFIREPRFLEARQIDGQRAALHDLRLYQLLRKLRAGGEGELAHSAPLALALADGARQVPSLAEAGLDDNVLREPPNAAWRDAWAVTEKLLLAMRDETAARGGPFMVAVLSSAGAVYPDAALRLRYAEALGVEDLFYPERRLRALGERHGITVVTLGEQMQRHADATGAYVHGFRNTRLGFGHWNKAGHALAAELIARRMCPA
jgi:hypothetical protein